MTPTPATRTRSVTRATPWAFLALTAVAAGGTYFVFFASGPFGFEASWRDMVRISTDDISYAIAAFLAEIGSTPGVAACGTIAAALFFALRQQREAAAILTTLLIGIALSQAAKHLVERPRPLDALYSYAGYSYPSGHSMGAAALTFSLAFAISTVHKQDATRVSKVAVRWMWIAAVSWTCAMMWSRTALGVHWLTDVIAGALVGYAAAVFAHRVWAKPHPRPHLRA